MDRGLHEVPQKTMGNFKQLLDGDATSAVGTAYVSTDERNVYLVSGVSGTVRDPAATLDRVFAGLPKVVEVQPARPGPMGGEARCGKGTDKGWGEDANPDDLFVRARSQVERPAG